MKRILAGLFLGFLFFSFAPSGSYAEMCGCPGKMGEDMPMAGRIGHRGMGMVGDGHHIWRHLKDLNLNEKQKEEIKEIRNRVTKDTIRMGADLRIARVELRDILDKDPVDMSAVETKLKQMSSMMTDIRLSHIKAMEEIKAKLTPDQREKFRKNIGRHGGWAHRGMGTAENCGQKERRAPAMEHRQH